VSRRPSPEGVLEELRDAIRPEVDACLEERIRKFRIQTWVLYGLAFATLAALAAVGGLVVNKIQDTAATSREVAAKSRSVATESRRVARANTALGKANRRTIRQLCEVALRQRRTLVLQRTNVRAYLKSPAGSTHVPLNDYIRKFSVPQLMERLRRERVPRSCRALSAK
jgi:hypothetical protein